MNAIDRTLHNNSDAEKFDWRSNGSVTVREQPAIAVYLNPHGQVVVRRERCWDEEEDCFIPIARENVLHIVKAILDAAGFEHAYLYQERPGGCCYDIDWPESAGIARMQASRPDIDWKAVNRTARAAGLSDERYEEEGPKDRTAAKRQRRRRQRLRVERDSEAVTGVTPDRDSVAEEGQLRLIAAE